MPHTSTAAGAMGSGSAARFKGNTLRHRGGHGVGQLGGLITGRVVARGHDVLRAGCERAHLAQLADDTPTDLLGWAHQPGQAGVLETRQFRIHGRINQQGLRVRYHAYERPHAMQRLLVLGDSFAWGLGDEESDRFSERLKHSWGLKS